MATVITYKTLESVITLLESEQYKHPHLKQLVKRLIIVNQLTVAHNLMVEATELLKADLYAGLEPITLERITTKLLDDVILTAREGTLSNPSISTTDFNVLREMVRVHLEELDHE